MAVFSFIWADCQGLLLCRLQVNTSIYMYYWLLMSYSWWGGGIKGETMWEISSVPLDCKVSAGARWVLLAERSKLLSIHKRIKRGGAAQWQGMGSKRKGLRGMEVSRRWVVTPIFLTFSRVAKCTGEGEKARKGHSGFQRFRKALAVIYFVLLQGKLEARLWPGKCLLKPRVDVAKTTVSSSLKLCHQALTSLQWYNNGRSKCLMGVL